MRGVATTVLSSVDVYPVPAVPQPWSCAHTVNLTARDRNGLLGVTVPGEQPQVERVRGWPPGRAVLGLQPDE